MNEIVFMNSVFLFLLILLPVIWYFLHKNNLNINSRIIIENYKKGISSKYILLLIFFIYVFLLAIPSVKNYKDKVVKNWVDIVVVFDLSLSMNAQDLKPTRLEASKNILNKFLDNIKTDRVWLVLFSKKPFIWIPLTFDYKILNETIELLNINSVSNNNPDLLWTNIWDALLMAWKMFDLDKLEDKNREKVVILMTDGDANYWTDPNIASKFLSEYWIKVYSVWIWWKEWGEISFLNYREFIPPITPDKLIKISEITWANAYFAYDNDSLENIFNDLGKLKKSEIEVDKIIDYKNFNNYIYIFLIILILLFYLLNFYKANTK